MRIKADLFSFQYVGRHREAIRNLSFECESAGITIVLGRSGIGKSTLMAVLAGLYGPNDDIASVYSGQLSINGLSPALLRSPTAAAWVPQTPMLLEHLTVLDNMLLPLHLSSSKNRSRSDVLELVDLLGLSEVLDCRPRELSGGMATRASLIRAIAADPFVLFLDEPFNGLDIVTRWDLYAVIRRLRGRPDRTTLLATHNVPEGTLLGDRILLLHDKDERTIGEVIGNFPATISEYGNGEAIAAARMAASAIERRLFGSP